MDPADADAWAVREWAHEHGLLIDPEIEDREWGEFEPCPNGCGGITDDDAGGPCSECRVVSYEQGVA